MRLVTVLRDEHTLLSGSIQAAVKNERQNSFGWRFGDQHISLEGGCALARVPPAMTKFRWHYFLRASVLDGTVHLLCAIVSFLFFREISPGRSPIRRLLSNTLKTDKSFVESDNYANLEICDFCRFAKEIRVLSGDPFIRTAPTHFSLLLLILLLRIKTTTKTP